MTSISLAALATFIIAWPSGAVLGQPKSAPQDPAVSVRSSAGASNAQVERGRYLTALGDCLQAVIDVAK